MSALLLLVVLSQADGGVPAPVFTPRLDSFAEYGARFPTSAPASNAFSVPRVHLGLDATWLDASARVLVEGAYATAGGALIGVSGDSVVVRLREAWAGYRWRFLQARLGMVPTLVVPELERGFRFRELAADGLQSSELLAPADFGGTLAAELPARLGWVGVAVTNGEGYTAREVNTGKNVELATVLRPLAPLGHEALEVIGLAAFGSSGLPEVPTRRLGGGVQWAGPVLGVGASAFHARGVLGDATREGVLVEGFARATFFEHLLLAGRAQYFARSLTADDAVFEALLGVGARAAFVEGFVAWNRTMTLGAARAALPAVDAHELRVVLRVRWPEDPSPRRTE